MDRKIIDYLIVADNDPFDMEKKVRKNIDNGYQPFSSPYLFYESKAMYETHLSVQAMVKYEEVSEC